MPSQFNTKYLVKGHKLDDDFFNLRFRDIDARLVFLEDAINNLDAAREQLVQLGLEQLSDSIDNAIASLQGLINGAQADLTATNAQIAAINGTLSSLSSAIASIIEGGSLPASVITVSSITGIAAAHVQDALAELQGDINAINSTISGLKFGARVVANTTARDALTGLAAGDIVFVLNDGDGKWAHYQITAAGTGSWSSATKKLVAAEDATLPITGGTLTGQLVIEQATPSKAFRVNSWAEVSGVNGLSLFGANLYAHWTGSAVEYRYANTHASLGYGAIRLSANGLEFAAASGATTADASVSPTWRSVYHSGNFTPADKANVAGDTFTGDISISKVAGNARALFFKSSAQNRWGIGATSAAESSGSAGSNFAINRYNDSGDLIGAALSIARNTGNATFSATVTASAYDTASDRRLKTAIKSFAVEQCRKVLGLVPVTFRFKRKRGEPEKPEQLGFIAQDVAEHLPHAVRAGEDGMLSIDGMALLAAALGVIKDQDRRIAALEAALAAR